MKKYVLLGLSLMLACFITGGFYIVNSFQSSTNNLKQLISLHQVEFKRKTLEHNIEVVQQGLLLQGSPHSDIDATIQNIEKMEKSGSICLSCHHDLATEKRLDNMLHELSLYMKLYSRTLTIRANQDRLQKVRDQAYAKGELLLKEVKSLSIASADKISARIDAIHGKIRSTNQFLIGCLVAGPIAILIITVFFLRRFTGSFDVLVTAAQDLSSGNLNRYIRAPLKDEFKTLADSFNSMVDSLNAERQNFLSVHALYQALFEAAGDGICLLDTAAEMGRIVSVNPATCKLYGYTAEELLTMNCLELSPPEEHDKFRQKMLQIMDGEWISCSITRRRKDGSEFPVDISAGPLEINQHKYILTFTRDVSERQQAQQEIQRANQMAIVGQMAAGLAHEIKNPLAGIKVSLDVISDDLDLPSEDKDVIARVLSEINRMERLLKSLLNYARPPAPHFDLVDINRLLDYSIKNVALTAGKAPEKKVLFEKDYADLPYIEADSAQLQQVLLNIYLNAIDALEGSGAITSVTRKEGEDKVLIEITDTGKGLPESAIDKIFNPFFTTKTKGSGLGLAICKRLIEQHNGSIDVHSTQGEGTSFVIVLPQSQQNRESKK